MPVKYYSIIVGGGSGSRMQSDLPKQFLLLNGKPVLMHTIEAFHFSELHPEIILVLNVDFHPYWEKLCEEYNFNIPHQLVRGGLQRFHSVKNALKLIKNNAIVAVHDAVRPLPGESTITSAFREAEKFGTAVTAVKSSSSVRQQRGEETVGLRREDIFLVQTPQVFKSDILHKAYKQNYRIEFTDDASVVERSGVEVRLVEGENSNIKITYPEDIVIAEALIRFKSGPNQT